MVVTTGSCSSAPLHPEHQPVGSAEAEPAAVAPAQDPDPVVLVTVDGARWQDVFDGADLMPALHALARERGAFVGADARAAIRATGPNFVSLPGYTEIFTGRPSTTCRDNECPPTRTPTFLDRAVDAGLSVAAFASWEKLDRAITARPGRFVVSAGRDHGDDSPPDLEALGNEVRKLRGRIWLLGKLNSVTSKQRCINIRLGQEIEGVNMDL
jgi:hypothetical protein